MDPNISNNSQQPPQFAELPVETPNSVQPPTPQIIKKSHKKLFILIVTIIIAAIVITAGYFAYNYYRPATAKVTNNIQSTNSAKANQTTNSDVEMATNALTENSTSEASVTNTDDSNIANDTSNAAGSVGDSINENNF